MKVGVTAQEGSIEAEVDPRFGRCPYFLIVDTETMEFEAIENSNAALGGGAGIQAGQLMAERGVKAVLTGNCGPNAFQTLQAGGIEVITGVSGTVAAVVERLKSGELKSSSAPSVGSHFGSGGMGGGGGMGRGKGRTQGMGRNRDM
ncbi:MAG: NifB/NifX family molybdenum-iron cluster-binding protein [Kiritimatiellia bacterium]